MESISLANKGFAIERRCYGGPVTLTWEPGQKRLAIALTYHGAYGMGEKYDALNQKGRTVTNMVEEKFCFQGSKTYCPAPFFWTDSGFGLYAGTAEITSFCFEETVIWVELPESCTVFLFFGAPADMIREYVSLFGSMKLPPKWTFGPWISANHWDSQEKVERAVEQAEEYGFPACALVAEAWSDEATFYIFRGAKYQPKSNGASFCLDEFDFRDSPWPDPSGMIQRLHQKGVHLLLWQIPVYKKQGPDEILNRQNELDRADAEKRGLCVHKTDGTPYTIPGGNWFAGSMIPDFTNPETERTWFEKRQYLTDMGVDGFKTDGGEFIYREDVRLADGTSGLEGKNRYAQDYTAAYTRHLRPDQALFSRAGFSGQHTTPIHWAGDQQSQNSELRSALRAGLSAALTGIPFWGFDIAGFAGPLPTLDLYRRATQLACFVPVMQWHSEPDGGQFRELMPGGEGNNERSPWNMAAVYGSPEFVYEMRFWHNLRMNLLPYLYSTAIDCVEQGKPMLRPLVYDWPHDAKVCQIEDEFLLGDALLVAPLLDENAECRSVYLPEGTWIDFFTRKHFEGAQVVTAGAKHRLPVFLRRGRGVVLNLGKTLTLGDSVGNQTGSYQYLHALLAGERGFLRFRDDLGNNFIATWHNGQVQVDGMCNADLSFELFGNQ